MNSADRIRRRKIKFAVFAGALLVAGLGAWYTSWLIESSYPEIAADIEKSLNDNLGSDIRLQGMRLQIFPRPHVAISSLVIPSPPGYKHGDLFQFEDIKVYIPLALIFGLDEEYVNTDIVIDKLTFRLFPKPGDTWNVNRLVFDARDRARKRRALAKKNAKQEPGQKSTAPTLNANLLLNNIGEVHIQNLSFETTSRGREYVYLQDMDFRARSIGTITDWEYVMEAGPSLRLAGFYNTQSPWRLAGKIFVDKDDLTISALLDAAGFTAFSDFQIRFPKYDPITIDGVYEVEVTDSELSHPDLTGPVGDFWSSFAGQGKIEGTWFYHHDDDIGFSMEGTMNFDGHLVHERLGIKALPFEGETFLSYRQEINKLTFSKFKGKLGRLPMNSRVIVDFNKKKPRAWLDLGIYGNLNRLSQYLPGGFGFGTGTSYVNGSLSYPLTEGFGRAFGSFYLTSKKGIWPSSRAVNNFQSIVRTNRTVKKDAKGTNGKGAPKNTKGQNSDWSYEEIRGTVKLRWGQLTTERLYIKTKGYIVYCSGSYNLYNRRIDALAQVRYYDSVEKILENTPVFGFLLSDGEEDFLSISVKIKGRVPNISFDPFTKERLLFVGGVVKRFFTSPLNLRRVFLPFMNDEEKKDGG